MFDEDDEKEDILKQLGGEVDDYAGSQLEDPSKAQGVTIEISVKPHGAQQEGPEENEEHDPIAHILGMCQGGCAQ